MRRCHGKHVCACICLVHQVAHPLVGSNAQLLIFQCFHYFSYIFYFLPLFYGFCFILSGVLFIFWVLFCTRLIYVFVFLPPLDTSGTFYSRIYLHNLISLVVFLSLPLLYYYIVFLSSFLGIRLLILWGISPPLVSSQCFTLDFGSASFFNILFEFALVFIVHHSPERFFVFCQGFISKV